MRTRISVILGTVFTAGLVLAAGSATAAEFSLSFDDAVINPGGMTSSLTPGVNIHNDVVIEAEDVVTLTGVEEAGAITVPAGGFVFERETRTITPFESYFTVDWRATGALTGTFDSATGQLELSGTVEQVIRQDDNVCVTGPVPLALSTETTTNGNAGELFTEGLSGDGVLAGTWDLPVAAPVTGGPDCDREGLACRAQKAIVTRSGDIALSTRKGDLAKGAPSYDVCSGPPGPAPGPASVTLSKSPGTQSFPASKTGSYRLDFTSGKEGASFSVWLGVPNWPDDRVSGSPVWFGEPVPTGTTSFVPGPQPPVTPSYFDCMPAAPGWGRSYRVEMGADSAAHVELPFELAAAPWTLDPLRPRISISDFYGDRELVVPPITVTGRLGPWVKVRLRGHGTGSGSVKAGRRFKLAGHVYSNRNLRGRKVKLWIAPGDDVPRRRGLGTARIGAANNFVKKVRGLPAGSRYEINAKLIGSKVAPSCGQVLSVG